MHFALLLVLSAGLRPVAIDYPADGAVFPPEFPAPAFLFRDSGKATTWRVGAPGVEVSAAGEPARVGEIDPRCVGATNEPPKAPKQRTWMPDAATWEAIKRASPATVTITGFRGGKAVSRGQVTIMTSKDPVGAPIFYRDVPLMPSELEKGVIKPLSPKAVPLIAWRLRYAGEPRSRLLMEGLHTCVNCHSMSRDGKTIAMDIDGPQNDKGLYAIVPVRPLTTVRNEDVIAWSTFRGKLGGKLRVGFMSQLSPDGQYVITTINDRGARGDMEGNYYVANFKDYRFLQVFYATRGILAWYSRAAGRLEHLPGADDPRYVHSNAVWSPDGKYLVFARAEAKDAYPPDGRLAERANDPRETPIRYDLYRIPFNGGRGGRAEPIAGASRNGMSNSFPRVSPDGRWIVFVKARNGLLMRPDSELYIVPSGGGEARRMRANTPRMNSWHSFSPNGRWMVFSSKGRSPYTQMYLTHIDENGADSPAILIENATAANRAVNLPEFLNGDIVRMEAPVTEFYRVFDAAAELAGKGRYDAALPEWRKAVALNGRDARAYNNLGVALSATGKVDEAIPEYRKALELDPEYPEALGNLGGALAAKGRTPEAVASYRKALEHAPADVRLQNNFATVLAGTGALEEASAHYRKAIDLDPGYAEAYHNLGVALARAGRLDEAIRQLKRAVALRPEFEDTLRRVQAAKRR